MESLLRRGRVPNAHGGLVLVGGSKLLATELGWPIVCYHYDMEGVLTYICWNAVR